MFKLYIFSIIIIVSGVNNEQVRKHDAGIERSFSMSTAKMQSLLELESTLINALNKYAEELQGKLNILRSGLLEMIKKQSEYQENSEKYISNPLNAFSLIRRMQWDWQKWHEFILPTIGEAQIAVLSAYRNEMPSALDVTEAAVGMHTIQLTYDLQPADMANGLLNGKKYSATLSSIDCYAIGYELFKKSFYYDAILWLQTSIDLYEEKSFYSLLKFTNSAIIELHMQTYLKIEAVINGLELYTNNYNETEIENEIEYEMKEKFLKYVEQFFAQNIHQPATNYEIGCRNEFARAPSKLHCRYNRRTAFLKLAAFKMEEISLDPYVVLYYDVLYDGEIAELKELALTELERSQVYADATGSHTSDVRTSMVHEIHPIIMHYMLRLKQRIADMTGLSTEGFEDFQVQNYGLGGKYTEHFDFFSKPKECNCCQRNDDEVMAEQGDRIATVLFYLSDVEQGGGTVFTRLNKTVAARKGTALFWYNLKHTGDGDVRTYHGGCPVIVGSKWVLNAWIREKAQVFKRPCKRD